MKVLPTATLPTRNPPAMEAEVTPAARSPSSPTATAPSPYATRQPARPTVAAALVTRPTRTGRAVARPAVLDPERLVLPSFSASAHALRDGRITTPSVAQLARPRLRPASVPVPAPNRS